MKGFQRIVGIFLFLLSINANFSKCHNAEIAVCVSGMSARFLPDLIAPLFSQNPDFKFTLFYNLQDSPLVYSTEPHKIFYPSSFFQFKTPETMKDKIVEAYSSLTNVEVGNVMFTFKKMC